MSGNFDFKAFSMVQQAPQDIREAYMRLVHNDNDGVLRLCPNLVSKYETSEGDWSGTAAAWLAFALSMDDQHVRALEICQLADKLSWNIAGAFYRYAAEMNSANHLDYVDQAFTAATTAIEFFVEHESFRYIGFIGRHLAGYGKRVAGLTCRNRDGTPRLAEEWEWARARSAALRGIHGLYLAVAINGELDDELAEELKPLRRLAAQFGIREADLGFMKDEHAVEAIFAKAPFKDHELSRIAISQLWNLTMDAHRSEKRLLADEYFQRCLEVEILDRTPEDDAFRGYMLYNRSVNLLRHYELEGENTYPEELQSVVQTIVKSWREFIQLYDALPPGYAAEFSSRTGFDAAQALRATAKDPLMGLTFMKLKDGTLVPGTIPH
jgi:hypothetical protein